MLTTPWRPCAALVPTSLCLLALLRLAGPASAATLTVTNTSASGSGSLSAALAAAGSGDTIAFDPTVFSVASPQTIALAGGLTVGKNLTLQGPGASVLTISGSGASGPIAVFTVSSGVTATLSGMTITKGVQGISNAGSLTLTGCTVTNNSGTKGKGIYNSGTLAVSACTISNNTALADNGGGITNTGTLTMSNSTLSGNGSDDSFGSGSSGGGIENIGTLALTSCTLSGNQANLLGGINVETGGNVTLTNCTLSKNIGLFVGGIGLASGSKMTLTSCTLTGNIGAGVSSNGSATIASSLIAGNTDSGNSGKETDIFGAFTSGGSNLIGDTDAAGKGFTGPHDQVGVTNPGLDPAGLKDNGGPTQTVALLPRSPAVDADYNALTATDQRGVSRPQGARNDIGAFESVPVPVTRKVPSQYGTIQAAVNAAANGDTVLIADGTYTGPGNVDIDFGGKNLTVASQNGPAKTIIDCGGSNGVNHRGFYLHSGETAAVISGLTIKNGFEGNRPDFLNFVPGYGGGIYNDHGCTLTLINCILNGNTEIYGDGAGVYNVGTLSLTNCALTRNAASNGGFGGAGVYNDSGGTATLTNCTLTGNVTQYSTGGGIQNSGTATLTNCTLSGNTAGDGGGGIFNVGSLTLINDILYGDTGDTNGEIYSGGAAPAASFCDIQGGYFGPGNINADPLFVNATAGDLHLKPGSPCLGAGTASGAPTTDADGTTRPNPPSIGAYELSPTTQAASSTRLLWTNPDGRALLWNVDPAGKFTIAGVYGPYNDGPGTPNWAATALAAGPDGLSHILWNNPDGRVILWTVDAGGKFTITGVYGPYNDGSPNLLWKATALSVGPDNVPHILWTNPDGKALYWNVKSDGTFTIAGVYGPYTDGSPNTPWTATALATGPDGLSHLLWTNPDGHMALWTVDGQGRFTPFFYGPYNDGSPNTPWTAKSVSVGSDNVPHLLWTNLDGKALLWNVKPDGTFSIPGVYGPYTENGNLWGATSLATGAGGLSHLLWNNPDGQVDLWTVNADGSFTIVGAYGPYNDGSPNTPWTAAAVSAGA